MLEETKKTQNCEFCIALDAFHGFCTELFIGKIIQRIKPMQNINAIKS